MNLLRLFRAKGHILNFLEMAKKNSFLFFIAFALGQFYIAPGLFAQLQNNRVAWAAACDDALTKGIEQRLTPGAVLVLVQSDSVLLLKGYGLADASGGQTVDAQKTLFQLGSIGKVFTAISVLQLVERGKLDLDADVNDYLNQWKISNPFPKPVTLRHLLTHSAGFDERIIGYMARGNESVVPLEQHLMRRMPTVYHPPGSEINYSNYSYGLAGLVVEKASGQPFGEYVRQHILQPLGMNASTYQLPDPGAFRGDYAVGYKTRDEGFVPVPAFPRHVPPAGSIISSGSDMAALLQELLRRDTLLNQTGFEGLFRRQFSAHPLLSGYTFGLEEQRINGHYAVAKGGATPGFLAEMLVIPEFDFGLFVAINTQTDNVMDSLFAALQKALPVKETPPFPAFSGLVEPALFEGVYRSNRCNHTTIEDMFELYQSPVTITASADRELNMTMNGWLYRYVPVNDSVFREKDGSAQLLVFSNFRNGKPQSLYTTVEINGLQLPASFARVRWYERPHFVNDEFPVVFLIIGFYLLLPIYWLFRWLLRKRKQNALAFKHLGTMAHLLGLAFSTATFVHLFGFMLLLARRREELLFGLPDGLAPFKYLHWLMVLLTVALVFQAIQLWREKEGWLGIRLYYTLFTIAAVAYGLFMWRWHFLSLDQ